MTCIFLLLLLVHSMTFKLKTTKITDKEEPSCTTPCGETGITATVCKTHSNILKQKHNTNLVLNLGQTGNLAVPSCLKTIGAASHWKPIKFTKFMIRTSPR